MIRRGRYKLVERFEDGALHLFDLESDIGERNDIKQEHPTLVSSMRHSLHRWYQEVDAQFLRARDEGPEPWRP